MASRVARLPCVAFQVITEVAESAIASIADVVVARV